MLRNGDRSGDKRIESIDVGTGVPSKGGRRGEACKEGVAGERGMRGGAGAGGGTVGAGERCTEHGEGSRLCRKGNHQSMDHERGKNEGRKT